MKKLLIVFIVLLTTANTYSQDFSKFEKHLYVDGNDTLPYRLLLPENFNPKTKYPFVLFLHGSGEKGNDNELQLVHGAALFLDSLNRINYPAIVVFPQCPKTSSWAQLTVYYDSMAKKRMFNFPETSEPTIAMAMLMKLTRKLIKEYKVDKKKIVVGGLSMGGMGTFEIVSRSPGLFAAAFPICGGGNPGWAPRMKSTAWWIFHGAKDDQVPADNSQRMVNALEAAQAQVSFTFYPNANHNSWDAAFAEKELMKWMLSR
jgi:predicted peptidase